jgi:thioesterase domain-containing protein
MEQMKPVEPCLPIHFQLLAIWERLLARKIDSVIASFIDLGGDDALAARMLREVKDEVGQTVPVQTFLIEPTVAGLTDALLDQHNPDEIVEVQRGNGAVPIFYFHGDILGGGFYVRSLAKHLGPDRPIYAVPPPEVTRDASTSIEEIAARRVAQLRKLRPHGPYIVGGFCISSLVAYEVARQLVAAGEEVKSVLLVDPELPNSVERACQRAIERAKRGRGALPAALEKFTAVNQKLARLQYVWQSPLRDKVEFFVGNARKLVRRRARSNNDEGNEAPPDVTRDGWRVDVFQWLATAYELKPYPGRVTILITDEQSQNRPSLVRKWRRMVAELQVSKLPGRHMTAITTLKSTLIARIKAELHSVQTLTTAVLSGLAVA